MLRPTKSPFSLIELTIVLAILGQPAKGQLIARFWADDCASAIDGSSARDDLEANYLLSNADVECAFYFRNAF